MPASKSKFLVPAIGAAVVVGGGVAAYLFFQTSGDVSTPLASAKIVPDEALMTAFVSTDSQSWSQLQKFGTSEAQQFINKSIKDFQSEMLAETNVDFEKDLKPWVGSVMFAFLPPTAADKAQEPNLLVVVGIKDKGNAFNFAQKLKSQKAAKTKETAYKGITIADITEQPGKTYSVALLNEHLVLSPEKKAIEQAIDTFKGEPSFASKEGATALLTAGVDVENPIAQIYLPDYGTAVQQLAASGSSPAQLSPTNLQQLNQVKSLAMGMGVDDAGLRLKVVTKLDPKAINLEYKPVPGKVVAQFPLETIALIGGQGIKTLWSAMVNQAETDPSAQIAVGVIRQQLKAINLDADKEIFGWMDGEFALGAISSNQGILAQTGFGGAMVIQTSDRKTAEAALSKIDALVKSYSINVGQRDVQGKSITEWKISPTEALLGHGWLDQNSLFIAIGGPLVDVMATKAQNTLDGSPTYKAAVGPLAKPSMGYFYLDMEKTMSLLNSPPFKAQATTIPPETMAVLNSIQGVGMSAIQSDKLTNQFEVLMALKPKTTK